MTFQTYNINIVNRLFHISSMTHKDKNFKTFVYKSKN